MGNVFGKERISEQLKTIPIHQLEPGVYHINQEFQNFLQLKPDSQFGLFLQSLNSFGKFHTQTSNLHLQYEQLYETIYIKKNEDDNEEEEEDAEWCRDSDDDDDIPEEEENNEESQRSFKTDVESNPTSILMSPRSGAELRSRTKTTFQDKLTQCDPWIIVKDWKLYRLYQMYKMKSVMDKETFSIISGMMNDIKEPEPVVVTEDEDILSTMGFEYLFKQRVFHDKLINGNELVARINEVIPKKLEEENEKRSKEEQISELFEQLKSRFSQSDTDINSIIQRLSTLIIKGDSKK